MKALHGFLIACMVFTHVAAAAPVSRDVVGEEEKGALRLCFPLGGGHPAYARQRCLAWVPSTRPEAVFLCLHGIQTFADWYGPLGRAMKQRGCALYALDRRGSGPWSMLAGNDNEKWHGSQRGDIADWHDWVADIGAAAHEIKRRHPGAPLILLGTSWGGKTALGAVTTDEGAKDFSACVLLSPAFETYVDPSLSESFLGGIVSIFNPSHRASLIDKLTPVRYSPSPAFQDRWFPKGEESASNPLLESITLRFASESKQQLKDAKNRVSHIKVPVLAIFGAADEITKAYECDQVLRSLREDDGQWPRPVPRLTSLLVPGLHHAGLVEVPGTLAGTILNWRQRSLRPDTDKHDIWMPAHATGCGLTVSGQCAASSRQLKGDFPGYHTGIQVRAGQPLKLTWDRHFVWQDRTSLPDGPGGLVKETKIHRLAQGSLIVPRDKDGNKARYFTLVALIHSPDGKTTRELLPFTDDRSTAEWTPKTSGELALVANDATFSPAITYTNNHGTLHLRIY